MSLFFDQQPREVASLDWHKTWSNVDILQGFLFETLLVTPTKQYRRVLWDRVAMHHSTNEVGFVTGISKKGGPVAVTHPKDVTWFDEWLHRALGDCQLAPAAIDNFSRRRSYEAMALEARTRFIQEVALPMRVMQIKPGRVARTVELVHQHKREDTRASEVEWRVFDACGFKCMPQVGSLRLEEFEAIAGAIVGLDLHDVLCDVSSAAVPWPHLNAMPWARVNRAIRAVMNIAEPQQEF